MALDSPWPGFATSQVNVDADLVRKAQAYLECGRHGRVPSDELNQEWGWFYRACDLAIRRFAIRCGARSIADCSQEVWKTLVMKLAEFKSEPDGPPFSSWLYTLVRSKAIDQIRQRTRHPTQSLANGTDQHILKSHPDPAAEWDRQSLRVQVHQVLRELEKRIPQPNYRILYMHWIEGRPMPEIAAFLNLSIEQVWARHHRAKQKFRCLFEHYVDKGFYEPSSEEPVEPPF